MSERQIRELLTLSFIDRKENILFLGPPGIGKTHLAISIGMEAIARGYKTYFITAHDLVTQLRRAVKEGKLEKKLRIDEMLKEHSELSYAYFLKELFREIYQVNDYDTADSLLEEWIQLAWSSPFPSFHQVAKTIENWKAQILQYFLTPLRMAGLKVQTIRLRTSKGVLLASETLKDFGYVYFWNVQVKLIKIRLLNHALHQLSAL